MPWQRHPPSLGLLPPPGLVSAETFAAASAPLAPQALRDFMAGLDVFSPNEAEAVSMLLGPGVEPTAALRCEPRRLTEPFLEAGAALVALRRGELGAVVQEAATGRAWQLPAYPGTAVADPTGCGNAFCGALLAALLAGEGPAAAAAWGCAAGSLMAEECGTPDAAPAQLAEEARRRQAAVLAVATPV
jgi:sugar/nucleoside kinase (ribokinase family)